MKAVKQVAPQIPPALDQLPSEVLSQSLSYLAPDPPPAYLWEMNSTGGWSFKYENSQGMRWLSSRREVLAAHQTSRRMATASAPYLHRTLVIASHRQLNDVFWSLENHPGIRRFVRHVCCITDISADRNYSGARRLIRREYEDPGPYDRLRRPFDIPACQVLDSLLSMTPNLHDLLFVFPNGQSSVQYFLPSIARTVTVAANPPDHLKAVVDKPLASLKFLRSLRLRCDFEFDDFMHGSRFSCDIMTYLPHLTHLEMFEIWGDSQETWRDRKDKYSELPTMPNLLHVRLYGTQIKEAELVSLCLSCPNLQTLLVHFEDMCEPSAWNSLPNGKTLNDALLKVSRTLTHLEILCPRQGVYLSRPDDEPFDPRLRRLIPNLTSIRHLAIDLEGLFGEVPFLQTEDGEELKERLPPSLESLHLACHWGDMHEVNRVWRSDLQITLSGLESFYIGAQGQFTRLRLAICLNRGYWSRGQCNIDDLIGWLKFSTLDWKIVSARIRNDSPARCRDESPRRQNEPMGTRERRGNRHLEDARLQKIYNERHGITYGRRDRE
jgi:hypothetical protein